MASNGYSAHNGAMNDAGYSSAVNGHLESRSRPLTVDEALVYSPFSSIVPFNSDIIPVPSIGLRSSASLFPTTEDRNAARQGLDSLNVEAANPKSTSQRLQNTLTKLQHLLQPEGLTQYKFKTRPRTTANSNPGSASNDIPRMSLTPFAQKLFDSTSVEYRYPSPETPSTPKVEHIAQKQNVRSIQVQNAVSNSQAHRNNATIEIEIPRKRPEPQAQTVATPIPSPRQTVSPALKSKPSVLIPSKPQVLIPPISQTFKREEYTAPKLEPDVSSQLHATIPTQTTNADIPKTSTSKFSIVMPQLPPTFNPEDYAVVKDSIPGSPDTPGYLSSKRKLSELEGGANELVGGSDQRQKADAAVRDLDVFLHWIFDSQDKVENNEMELQNSCFTNVGDELGLASKVQQKVEGYLSNVISVGRYFQVSLDDLLRLQKICEGALRVAETIDLKVEETMGESEIDSWLQRVAVAELGVKAARTTLRVMSGGREDRQLYPENAIQAALNVFKNCVETCIVPIVEMRSSGSSAPLFKLLSAEKKRINDFLAQCRKLFARLSSLITSIELSETVLNTLEFTSSRLIFVENAHSDKDSVLGIPKFDNLRVVAMDVLAQIFLSSPTQRIGIFDEILTSLEKLPVTKQSARQFKLTDGGSIQFVSALIMRLVQISATKYDDGKSKRRTKALQALDGDEDMQEAGAFAEQSTNGGFMINSEARAERQHVTAIQELGTTGPALLDIAKYNASYFVNYIVGRAMKSTKTGDTPYRNLLDLFVEDFITCLSFPDWPAAEMLLRLLVYKMVQLIENHQTPAPSKNMALDLLGSMVAAISELNSHIQKSASSTEATNGQGAEMMGEYLSRLARDSLEKKKRSRDLVSWTGPFRASLEYLQNRCNIDPQLSNAVSFITAEWASTVHSTYDEINDDEDSGEEVEKEYGRLAFRLQKMLSDRQWLSREYVFKDTISNAHARLAYGIILLHSSFCETFDRVLHILLTSMASEQATVRSKSLKSVNQLLETDPTILDRNDTVKLLILKCSNDSSVQVRDSALGLIGKCITLRPALEESMVISILQRVNDSGVGVRKRAMKLCKEIYLRNQHQDIRSQIADALLHRVTDLDESVQELARQTIEDVWLSPFYQPTLSKAKENEPEFRKALGNQVALMTRTVQRGGDMSTVLDKVLQNMLSKNSTSAAANFRVCTVLVATMFETIIDNSVTTDSERPSARDALQILTIFAKSSPKLFTPDQIKLLQPYVNNVGAKDDLAIYRFVVIIFRHVLPQLSKIHRSFLVSIRAQLLPSISRMNRIILDDLVACLWIISVTLDDYQNLTALAIQTLSKIILKKGADLHKPGRPEDVPSLIKLLTITGMFGKHCDLDPQIAIFRQKIPSCKGNSVSRLMADTFAPFSTASQPVDVRKAAMDAIGMVCQSWPKNFDSANIYTSFQEAFHEQNPVLEAIILRAFKEFLTIEEKRSEVGADGLPGAAAESVAKLGVMGGSQGDGVALSIAQRFLTHITRIALSSQDDEALLATEVLASINRQGLVHPKETAVALIALETSQNVAIAELAIREHRAAHEKHETILEKEYMRGVFAAYVYHRDVVNNTHGANTNPFTSKLHRMIDVLKISKVKNRKKFYDTLCNRIDFDPTKMEREELPEHLQFAQFIIENMAFFEYATIDELMSAISAMERVVATTGTGIAHSIETEVFHVKMDQPLQIDENGISQPVGHTTDPLRLSELTAFSMVLSSLWETRTYLRRQYGLTNSRSKETKAKGVAKDLNRAPVKAPFVNGDNYWEQIASIMSASGSEETMLAQCRSFVELLSVDEDVRIAAEADEEEDHGRLNTPSEDEEDGTPGPPGGSGRGRKRKASGTPGGRKKHARAGSKIRGRQRKKSVSSHDSDLDVAFN
ncbi:hypothetical protein BP5796_05251 [Coleophoma crateriformis]|uniref:Sister chromatid cohesion protein n=1 Tax=Coleophoma crateriformis TaxID=565419 RepID=A0A3D8S2M1_9HELO|nr:hypothetical protein BP5796_05251 [Coleophoma crateriformis]